MSVEPEPSTSTATSAAQEATAVTAGEDGTAPTAALTFVGTATTVLELGSFTVLTDPNFLHKGQRAYLGKGLWSRRLTDPALEIDQLPRLDAVVLSHLHGDHFDRVARRGLDRRPPVLTTPEAARRLGSWGFDTRALSDWQQHVLGDGGESLTVTAVPGIHARGVMGAMLPPVMGSVIEHRVGDEVQHRVYVSGDTLTGDHLDAVRRRFPDIDTAVVHLGGTRVLFHTVTMDADQGVDFLGRIRPRQTVPVHHSDYGVFRSPLSAFLAKAGDAGHSGIRVVRPGERAELRPTPRS
ncbi:MBL fold metallo-hydrolase [Terrabacter sp. NPDC080008]|uniref:MBL fold metallo-hydrolase n=1 Tax=Terrabacter sp. NPDC080008 TaxID=3155176 RepID=UPI00344C1E69